ncbi:hypothetical protein T12_2102 [Trichinella patagoniensis]|uniref:Uncharacterized protein n=1 Tax=Trichinella patagoniensis TaxID=990121 RepID=A0A0V0ZIY8_9BILA|nr:hypothetical protein T12_2102 [Trichinella patagoniensis]
MHRASGLRSRTVLTGSAGMATSSKYIEEKNCHIKDAVKNRRRDRLAGGVTLRSSSKIRPGSLLSLTPNNMIAWHGIFQLLDRVSFSSRQPLFPNETRLMKSAMRRARRSKEDLPLTFP